MLQWLRADHSHPRTVPRRPPLPPGSREDSSRHLSDKAMGPGHTLLCPHSPPTALPSHGPGGADAARSRMGLKPAPTQALWPRDAPAPPQLARTPEGHRPWPHPPCRAQVARQPSTSPCPCSPDRRLSNPVLSTVAHQISPFFLQNLISFPVKPPCTEHFKVQ